MQNIFDLIEITFFCKNEKVNWVFLTFQNKKVFLRLFTDIYPIHTVFSTNFQVNYFLVSWKLSVFQSLYYGLFFATFLVQIDVKGAFGCTQITVV